MGTLGANTGKILFADSVYLYGCVFNNVGSLCDSSRLFKPIGVRAKRVPLAFDRARLRARRFLIRTGVRIYKGGRLCWVTICSGLPASGFYGLPVASEGYPCGAPSRAPVR